MRVQFWWIRGNDNYFNSPDFEPLRGKPKFIEWGHDVLPRVGEHIHGELILLMVGADFVNDILDEYAVDFAESYHEVTSLQWKSIDGEITPVIWC